MSYKEQVKQMPLVIRIKEIVRSADPTAQLILYGSRARGDHREDSDWDLLVLVDKDEIKATDRSRFWDPLYDLELEQGAEINTTVYPQSYWNRNSFMPFHKNVTNEGIKLL